MGELHKMQEDILALTLTEKYQLHAWLQEAIRIEQIRADRETKRYLEHQAGLGYTYQQEYIKCGKPGCKCNDGDKHGPYWYAYWSEGNKTRKKYIGKNLKLPKESDVE
jgi:hypothetical protein